MARLVVVALALSLALAGAAAGAGCQSGKLVTYVHSGGFTGDHDSLTVFRSGKADSSNGQFVLTTRRRLSLQTRSGPHGSRPSGASTCRPTR